MTYRTGVSDDDDDGSGGTIIRGRASNPWSTIERIMARAKQWLVVGTSFYEKN
jgi:hypothetical protein